MVIQTTPFNGGRPSIWTHRSAKIKKYAAILKYNLVSATISTASISCSCGRASAIASRPIFQLMLVMPGYQIFNLNTETSSASGSS